ncbi:MAG TPA: hypothetical protein VK034_08495, partial [Enhygromyxa sp.]|nr:hypothetical protein [Enhygromyxa sp.]
MTRPTVGWVFDELPPSRARRGGREGEHVFGHALGTFVREVVQNGNDQALGRPRIDFDLIDLAGDDLRKFQAALRWDQLRAHLAGTGSTPTPSGRRLAAFLEQVEAGKRLRVCRISDQNTVGLTGEEDGEHSHFRALCKDMLFSVKQAGGEGAGGSYGLGKSVLWSFSGLATVLFASTLSEHPPGRRSPRLIGRAELPYHEVDGEPFTGPGWFGREVDLDEHRRRAESLWSRSAAAFAQRLLLERDPDQSGTSILVLGFCDPTAEDEVELPVLADELRRHAAEWFWPALQGELRGLEIRVDGRAVEPADHKRVAPFVDCWRRSDRAKPKLEQPGDIAKVGIEIELPRPRDGGRSVRAQLDLLVRLASDDELGPRRLAMFRGAGMVVEYRDFDRMSGVRPFHAILLGGLARGPEPSSADRELERFLRAAEPPGHDTWEVTPAIKDGWVRGYGRVFPSLWDQVSAALRELLAPVVEVGVSGPDRLRKRFPLGRIGGSTKEPSAFHFREFEARLHGDTWHFTGRIEPEFGARPWLVTLELHSVGEDGSHVAEVPIASLRVEPSDVSVDVIRGQAQLSAPLGVRELTLTGHSCAVEGDASVAML